MVGENLTGNRWEDGSGAVLLNDLERNVDRR